MISSDRRKEIAAFLRTRRAQLTAGVRRPPSSRRTGIQEKVEARLQSRDSGSAVSGRPCTARAQRTIDAEVATMTDERILHEATILPGVLRYHAVLAVFAFGVSIVGSPLLLIVLPIEIWYRKRYYRRLRVILTSRDLKLHRGLLFTEEKSIPLEKITDLAVYQGPLMRHFGLKGIRVETAGQTGDGAALVKVIGIEDTDGFRDLVLRQRDRVTEPSEEATAAAPAVHGERALEGDEVLQALHTMNRTLARIEQWLSERDQPV